MTHRKVFLIMKQNETGLQTVSAAQWQLNEVIQAIRRETISVLHVLYSHLEAHLRVSSKNMQRS
jgi:hypothetical protein